MKASKYIREMDNELADFLDEELKDVKDCRYPTTTNYVPTKDELKEFTLEELTDILMDAGLDADIAYNTPEFESLNNRYELIKELVIKERLSRYNEI